MRTSIHLSPTICRGLVCLILGASVFVPGRVRAATISAEAGVGNAGVEVGVSGNEAVRLPYGVADVVKLARAQVSEDVILSFVQNSGTAYQLKAADIIYLKDHVSNRILSAMLEQRPQVANSAPVAASPSRRQTFDNSYQNYPPQQPPAYVESAPSSVYVVPSSPFYYSDYYQPYYYPSYSYGYSSYRLGYPYCGYGRYGSYGFGSPSLSFNFGFGGRGFGGFGRGGDFGHGGGSGRVSVGGSFGHSSGGGGHIGGSAHSGGGGGGHSHR
jgi:hypothetical protein